MLDMAIWIRYDNCINKGTNVCFLIKEVIEWPISRYQQVMKSLLTAGN